MAINKRKFTINPSGEFSEKAILMVARDIAELENCTIPKALELMLMTFILTNNEEIKSWIKFLVHTGSIRATVAQMFSENAGGINCKARYDFYRPLVEYAAKLSLPCFIDTTYEVSPGDRPVFHCQSCWDDVASVLEEHAKKDAYNTELSSDTTKARKLANRLEDGKDRTANVTLEARQFFDIVLNHWDLLGNYSYTFRALMDVVKMSSPWDETALNRSCFMYVLHELFDKKGGETNA